ncbi:MAG: hypothetical protein K0Q79_977 [Flavipsychrobacter sp.]|jgi:hypothetical protein|nr:hypothetical protein [Flavipsychrobacter sp.]
MNTLKFVLFGALGVAAVVLLTSERARNMRVELEDKAKENADLLREKLYSLTGSASHTLSELRTLLSSEIEGLSSEARTQIENILNKTARSANGVKRNVANKLA